MSLLVAWLSAGPIPVEIEDRDIPFTVDPKTQDPTSKLTAGAKPIAFIDPV